MAMNPGAKPDDPPRLVPDLPLPPYAHVPGRTPHPVSDPAGHSYGIKPSLPEPPDPERWEACRPYLYGLDLFNHGYYWEAHEVWEGLWHACGRKGRTADFLKALIKLAAAGVKVREDRPRGVRTHARRAAEIFQRTANELGREQASYLGLCLSDLIAAAARLADHPPATGQGPPGPVKAVVGFLLRPQTPAAPGGPS
jgi:hypothetical protein